VGEKCYAVTVFRNDHARKRKTSLRQIPRFQLNRRREINFKGGEEKTRVIAKESLPVGKFTQTLRAAKDRGQRSMFSDATNGYQKDQRGREERGKSSGKNGTQDSLQKTLGEKGGKDLTGKMRTTATKKERGHNKKKKPRRISMSRGRGARSPLPPGEVYQSTSATRNRKEEE